MPSFPDPVPVRIARSSTRRLAVLLLLLVAAWCLRPALSGQAAPAGRSDLQRDFAAAAGEFGVPGPILLALSYHLSLWETHGGTPNTSGGYGLMDLTHADAVDAINAHGNLYRQNAAHDPALHTLDLAARLLHLPRSAVAKNPAANIRGGAAVLARDARLSNHGRLPRTLAGWYEAVVRYGRGEGHFLADEVFATMRSGARRLTADDEFLTLAPQSGVPLARPFVTPLSRSASKQHIACPPVLTCRYVPAAYELDNPNDPTDYGNYDVASRPKDGLAIRTIVIHDTEGSYASAIASFQNPVRYASANYVIRSSDGLVTQMVPNHDVAWHAGNYYVNIHSIGIEHEGVAIEGATWYSELLYETSAALVRYLALRYHIPLDRAHIVGHDEVPGLTPQTQAGQHWDPGPFWDWADFMSLVGAPLLALPPAATSGNASPAILAINPTFVRNEPAMTNCDGSSCQAVKLQPANFVDLRLSPAPHAPLFGDPALHSTGQGTTQASDWGDKAVTGEEFVRIARHGEWDAIDYAGHEVWFRDPPQNPTAIQTAGTIVTPRGTGPIPVYGCACAETSAYPSWIKNRLHLTPLQYTIAPGQMYVASGLVTSDYYWAPTQTQHRVIRGRTRYYQIFLNHRFAFVRASDVTASTIAPATPTPTPTPTASPTPTVTPTESAITLPSPTPTPSPSPTPVG